MSTPALDINTLLDRLREEWAKVVKERNELRAERARLREGLELAAKRIDFLTNWIENTYGGANEDVALGRKYAATARAILNDNSEERSE